MSSQAPIVCVAAGDVSSLVAALKRDLRYPLVEIDCAAAKKKVATLDPLAIVVAAERVATDLVAGIVDRAAKADEPFTPILAPAAEGWDASTRVMPLPLDPQPARVTARLAGALRIRALHATVLRRAAAQDKAGAVPSYDDGASLNEATVLISGRGGGYPALATAIGERVGLVGTLSLEAAKRYLEERDIDGIVIGDGFSGRAVETFLDQIRADVRFRDLPLVVADSRIGAVDFDSLPNGERVRGGAEHVLAHLLPLVHLHAFAARLRRCARSLETKGFVDADTGLLTCDAFVRDLTRAVETAKKQRASLSLARFAFARIGHHASLDAARIVSRLVRAADFACQDDDGSIHVAFTDTDLKAAHVIARRIASVLKHTMLTPDPETPRLNPEVSLVTRKAADNAETLLARVRPHPIAAE